MNARIMAALCNEMWAIQPETLQLMAEIVQERTEGPEAVESRTGQPLVNSHETTVRAVGSAGVAVVPVIGPIFRYANLFTRVSGATSTEMLAQDIESARANPDITHILLNVDSPGGAASGISELAGMIRTAAEEKPVWAYVDGMGASGSYWLAAAAGRIAASATAEIGSVGVVAGIRRSKGGVIEIVSRRAPNKRLDPETEQGRTALQVRIDDLESVFYRDLAAYRRVTEDHIAQHFGGGDVMISGKALSAGMIDAVSTFEQTLAALAVDGRPLDRKGRQRSVSHNTRSSDMGIFSVFSKKGEDEKATEARIERLSAAFPGEDNADFVRAQAAKGNDVAEAVRECRESLLAKCESLQEQLGTATKDLEARIGTETEAEARVKQLDADLKARDKALAEAVAKIADLEKRPPIAGMQSTGSADGDDNAKAHKATVSAMVSGAKRSGRATE